MITLCIVAYLIIGITIAAVWSGEDSSCSIPMDASDATLFWAVTFFWPIAASIFALVFFLEEVCPWIGSWVGKLKPMWTGGPQLLRAGYLRLRSLVITATD